MHLKQIFLVIITELLQKTEFAKSSSYIFYLNDKNFKNYSQKYFNLNVIFK